MCGNRRYCSNHKSEKQITPVSLLAFINAQKISGILLRDAAIIIKMAAQPMAGISLT